MTEAGGGESEIVRTPVFSVAGFYSVSALLPARMGQIFPALREIATDAIAMES